jgi:hypothetical protein
MNGRERSRCLIAAIWAALKPLLLIVFPAISIIKMGA